MLQEIATTKPSGSDSPFDIVRRKYLAKLNQHTSRNIICYYSGFLSKPKIEGIEVNDDDKNGFMQCIHKMDRTKGLDLFLHTPGGDVAATESLVHYLKDFFGEGIRAVIPQIAMSAGTMIACSCNRILMGKHSNIGPVDPQFNGIPAIGVIKEVETAYTEISRDPRYAAVWSPILGRLPPSFLQQCQWAVQRSEDFIRRALADGMMKRLPDAEREAALDAAVKRLTDLTYNKGHNRHIHCQECIDLRLNVELLEDPADRNLQDLILTVHHCYMHTLSNTPAFKIIEDHRGRASVKQQVVQQQLLFQVPQNGMPAALPAFGQ